jgi:sarcosine oxidase
LWLANDGESSIYSARRIFERHKLKHDFLDVRALRGLCPGMDVPAGTVALFEPEGGALLAEESIRAVAECAVRSGARYARGRAKPPRAGDSMHSLEIENGEPVEADVFVFACGSWLPKLFPEALGDAIFPTRQEVFFFEPPTLAFPIWVDQTDPRIPYGFPDIDGAGVKVGFHRAGPRFDPDSGSREVGREQIREAADYLSLRFPAMHKPVFRGAQVCHYENTVSGDFLIDRHPSIGNVWFAGGGSGHGFKHGPAVGEYMLESIRQGYSAEVRFRLEGRGGELARRVF